MSLDAKDLKSNHFQLGGLSLNQEAFYLVSLSNRAHV